ncbi:hypothetical protein [Bordetella genomosp. 4]|uniref:Uncharacterized protein n=1 Tax=Bordetella genomosp. 4 TaxID=463044 RepID=A0A261URV2_9BORD|nr:hypothetical protein [Bordetella genomosp. 4]OZI64626.1 hypothetical protein CAL20_02950 [Bordetella genomosp. 4]
MMQVQQYPSVVTDNPDLPKLVRSADAQAIAKFPDFGIVIDPSYIFNDGKSPINRATGQLMPTALVDNPLVIGTFPNGAPCFDILASANNLPSGVNVLRLGDVSASPFPATEFSMAFVMMRVGAAASTLGFLTSANGTAGNPRILVNTAGRLVIANGTAFPVSDTVTSNPLPTRYVITYSNDLGGKLFRDEALISSSPTAFADPGSVLNRMYEFNKLNLGTLESFLLSVGYHTTIDLSRPQNAGHLARINKHMRSMFID